MGLVQRRLQYPNSIGPGVYDIHLPNIPALTHMVAAARTLREQAVEAIPA